MSEYKLKTGKIGEAVVGAYKKVEDAFVDKFLEKDGDSSGELHLKTGKIEDTVVKGYKKVEDSVVDGYKKIENAFVDTFLETTESEEEKTNE